MSKAYAIMRQERCAIRVKTRLTPDVFGGTSVATLCIVDGARVVSRETAEAVTDVDVAAGGSLSKVEVDVSIEETSRLALIVCDILLSSFMVATRTEDAAAVVVTVEAVEVAIGSATVERSCTEVVSADDDSRDSPDVTLQIDVEQLYIVLVTSIVIVTL